MLFSELKDKEVVCLGSGARLGLIDDVEFDDTTARIKRFFIFGRSELFGFGGRSEDIVVDWEEVDTVGSDIILVRSAKEANVKPRKKPLLNI
ncbi:MAG: YlmC/YmxH family sporulation protein [Oscillospiraceae bacterium]